MKTIASETSELAGMRMAARSGLIFKTKKPLANPQARITEVAYEAGFASLTHFNRMFRRIAGQSPTDFRRRMAHA